MNLSVVITTYDRNDDLIECIQSLAHQFDPPEEIIVVDDGDWNATHPRIEDMEVEGIQHVKGPGDGLAAARNRGAATATGDVVCYIDDDVVLPPNWTRQLKATYERFPDAAGVGGYVLNYNPSGINKANIDSFGYRFLQGVRMAFLYDRIGDVSPIGILYAPHVFMTAEPRHVDTLQGCNMSYRTAVFDDHQFDEWYGTSGSSAAEEIDFAVRVSREKGELIYDPRLVALHKRSIGSESGERAEVNYGNVTNLTYFVLKHQGIGNFVLLTIAMAVYSVLKWDADYLVAVKAGVREYWNHGRVTTGRGEESNPSVNNIGDVNE